jgi:hypothetical protein
MSTRNARRVISRVGSNKINKASRYRGEWEGECRWAEAASRKHINVSSAAMGWTMRIDEREDRALEESEKSPPSLLWKIESASGMGMCQYHPQNT